MGLWEKLDEILGQLMGICQLVYLPVKPDPLLKMLGETLYIAFGKISCEIGCQRSTAIVCKMQMCKKVHIFCLVVLQLSRYHERRYEGSLKRPALMISGQGLLRMSYLYAIALLSIPNKLEASC